MAIDSYYAIYYYSNKCGKGLGGTYYILESNEKESNIKIHDLANEVDEPDDELSGSAGSLITSMDIRINDKDGSEQAILYSSCKELVEFITTTINDETAVDFEGEVEYPALFYEAREIYKDCLEDTKLEYLSENSPIYIQLMLLCENMLNSILDIEKIKFKD